MNIQGKIHEIGDTIQVSETFRKRDLVIEYADNPEFPEYIKFEAIQDKASILDNFNVGDEVDVSFNFRGRKWTDKTGKDAYFNSLVLWKIGTVGE